MLDVGIDYVSRITLAKGIAVFFGSTLRFNILKFDFSKAAAWSRKFVRESPVSSSLVIAIMLAEEILGLIPRLIRKIYARFSTTQLIVLFKR
jgi:hypothetical protein